MARRFNTGLSKEPFWWISAEMSGASVGTTVLRTS
jgi:hypothetical protein